MNINDSKKIRKKLKEEYNENCSKIDDLNEKIGIINANNFATKANLALVYSIIPWFASMFIFFMSTIVKSGVIPLNMVQPLLVGVPALIGITVEELFMRKSKYREKLSEFSKAKTQKEKIEESTRYEIEIEKLKNLNKILKKNYDDLLEKENMINSLSKNYNITSKDDGSKTVEEITTNINKINDILVDQKQNINIATTKCVLKEKFRDVRNKSVRFSDMSIFGVTGGVLCMIFYSLPYICMSQLPNIQFQTSIIGVFSPFVIGGLVCSGYYSKRQKDYTVVFKNLNNKLGDNAISEFRDYEEDKQIDKDLENIINDTCAVKLLLESEKQKLENITLVSNSESVMNDSMKKLNNNDFSHHTELTEEELKIDEGSLESSIMDEERGSVLVNKMIPQNNRR